MNKSKHRTTGITCSVWSSYSTDFTVALKPVTVESRQRCKSQDNGQSLSLKQLFHYIWCSTQLPVGHLVYTRQLSLLSESLMSSVQFIVNRT